MSRIEIFLKKKRNFCQKKRNFCQKKEIFVKKKKFLSKKKNFVKKYFVTNRIFLVKLILLQNGLFKLIVRHTKNCDLTERLLLESLQWFETFKQYYSCVIDKKDPDPTPHVEIKPFDDQKKTQTFLLTSLSKTQCHPRHTEC